MPPKFARTPNGASKDAERQALLDESDDEDFFLSGPSAQTSRLGKDDRMGRLQGEVKELAEVILSKLQGQVDEVVGVMQDNIGKVLSRGDKLEDLQDKSEDLSANADMFRSRAKSMKTQMWWKECRMRILLAIVLIVILAIIIVPIVIKLKKNGN